MDSLHRGPGKPKKHRSPGGQGETWAGTWGGGSTVVPGSAAGITGDCCDPPGLPREPYLHGRHNEILVSTPSLGFQDEGGRLEKGNKREP